MSATDLGGDLNATIAAAVNARIEASVLAALAGDEVIGRYVSAALNSPVDDGNRYRDRGTKPPTFLQHTLAVAMKEAVKGAVMEVLAQEMEVVKNELRLAIKRNAGAMAEGIAGSLAQQTAKGYGVTVQLNMPWNREF